MADVQTQTGSIEAHALARHVRMSPQKARLVMDLIRGAKAQDALQTLKYTQKRAAKHIEKVLRSAIANAERKAEDAGAPLDVDELFVANCFVNEGPRWKRLRPAPMGRAFRYQKRTAHLWVGVAEHHVAAAQRVAAIEAEAEAQKILQNARSEVDNRLKHARHELTEYAGELASDRAEQLLREKITDADRQRLFRESLKEVEGAHS